MVHHFLPGPRSGLHPSTHILFTVPNFYSLLDGPPNGASYRHPSWPQINNHSSIYPYESFTLISIQLQLNHILFTLFLLCSHHGWPPERGVVLPLISASCDQPFAYVSFPIIRPFLNTSAIEAEPPNGAPLPIQTCSIPTR